MANKYDSTEETLKHIKKVQGNVGKVLDDLMNRASVHDASKLLSPEKEVFDEMTPLLEGVVFGSQEYTEMTRKMKPALQHHYEHNSHHPQHYPNGINGMCLLDLIEMLCDWKASGERGKDGNIFKSIEIQKKRFKIDEQLAGILTNTALKLWPEALVEWEKLKATVQ